MVDTCNMPRTLSHPHPPALLGSTMGPGTEAVGAGENESSTEPAIVLLELLGETLSIVNMTPHCLGRKGSTI